MTGQERYDLADEHLLRLEQVVDIALTVAADGFCENPDGAVERLMDDMADGVDPNTDPSMRPVLEAVADFIEDMPDEVGGALVRAGLMGYACQFATPVLDKATSDMRMYSWSHCWLSWFYGETMVDCLQAAAAWSARLTQQAREKQ